MQRNWQPLHPYKSAVPPLSPPTTSFLSMHCHALFNRHLILKGDFPIHPWKPLHGPLCKPHPKILLQSRQNEAKKKKKSQQQWSFWQTKVPAVHAHKPSPLPNSSCPHFPELTEICLYSTWVRQVRGPYWVFPGTSVTQTTKKSLSNHREAKKKQLFTHFQQTRGNSSFLNFCLYN